MRFFIRFCPALILSTLYCLNLLAGPQIINGEEVTNPLDPVAKSTVRIRGHITRASFTCSGVLIRQDLVLTAGHCLGPGWATIEIFFSDGSGPITLSDQIRPDNYNPKAGPLESWNDIALLKLKVAAPSEFTPVGFIAQAESIFKGQNLLFAGYGQSTTSPDSTDGLGVLRKITQSVLDPQLTSSEFLVNLRGGGPCFGDSGGPAFVQTPQGLKLAGITSRLTKNDLDPLNPKIYLCTNEIIYTNVQSQMTWLKSQMLNFLPNKQTKKD